MKKTLPLILIVITIFLYGCAEKENIDIKENDVEVKGYNAIDFDVPESWTKNPFDDDVAILSPMPDPNDVNKVPTTNIAVLDEGEGNNDTAKEIAKENYDTAIELFSELNPKYFEKIIQETTVYYTEKDPDIFIDQCEKGVTYIYFSKENNVYSIMLTCDSVTNHLDMLETVIETISLE